MQMRKLIAGAVISVGLVAGISAPANALSKACGNNRSTMTYTAVAGIESDWTNFRNTGAAEYIAIKIYGKYGGLVYKSPYYHFDNGEVRYFGSKIRGAYVYIYRGTFAAYNKVDFCEG
jgi:hypothetical protein